MFKNLKVKNIALNSSKYFCNRIRSHISNGSRTDQLAALDAEQKRMRESAANYAKGDYREISVTVANR